MPHGFSFIEALIALVILSIAILGYANLQAKAIFYVHKTYLQAVANRQAVSLLERYRASSDLSEIYQWNQENISLLPHGKGELVVENFIATVTISWDDLLDHSTPNKLCLQTGV